jgi:hypothetical protein
MAIGWLTALKLIPWSDVISNAPLVAEGAKKLWRAAAKKPAAPELSGASASAAALTGTQTVAALVGRVATLESTVSDLHSQMVASSELIKTLAEQNAQLIVRIETQRLRLIWLAAITVLTAATAMASLVLATASPAA